MSTEPVPSFVTVSFPVLPDERLNRVTEEARTRGHSAGYAAGLRAAAIEARELQDRRNAEHAEMLRQGQAELTEAVRALKAAVQALSARTAPVLQDAQDTLAVAALELAEAIVGRELSAEENSARSALARALADVDTVAVQRVRMNPSDLALLEPATRETAAVPFVGDASLGRGDAITEFDDGILDARIGTALARAKAALLGGAA